MGKHKGPVRSLNREGYWRWSKAFLNAGKNGLTRDTLRDGTLEEVKRLKDENETLNISH